MDCKLYVNGDIITMEDNLYADAVFVKNGIIKAVGRRDLLQNLADDSTVVIDLNGKTLIPAFIDSHNKFTTFAKKLYYADISDCRNFADVIKTIKEFIKNNVLAEDEPIMAVGYDHVLFEENAHPTRQVLDKASSTHPIIITHKSGHMGVINSIFLKHTGIDKNTPDPVGGKIGRDKSKRPNGYLEENALFEVRQRFCRMTIDRQKALLSKAQDIFASCGITTTSDGFMNEEELELLSNSNLMIDVCGYVDIINDPDTILEKYNLNQKSLKNLKLLGYKIALDGTVHDKSAWITFCYREDFDYSGYPIHYDVKVTSLLTRAVKEKRQVAVHCTGDAAADQFIRCYENVLKANGGKSKIRPIMIHAEFLRDDQLEKMKKLGIIPSFFITHGYEFSDLYLKNFGMRAMDISPCKTAAELDIPFTLHRSSQSIIPNILKAISYAVNRMSSSGTVMGQNQCISPLDALKAVTINAAHQYFEEDKKGSIVSGKNADLVILSDNPLKVSPEKIQNISVVETIKQGKTIFKLTS